MVLTLQWQNESWYILLVHISFGCMDNTRKIHHQEKSTNFCSFFYMAILSEPILWFVVCRWWRMFRIMKDLWFQLQASSTTLYFNFMKKGIWNQYYLNFVLSLEVLHWCMVLYMKVPQKQNIFFSWMKRPSDDSSRRIIPVQFWEVLHTYKYFFWD